MIAGQLELLMSANLARISDDMRQATGIVGDAMAKVESSVASAMSALGALGIGISAVGFVGLVKGSIEAMDHLENLSKSTNLTVETLAGLRVAAKQSGGDIDSISIAITRLAQNMGKSPEKFAALGVSAKDPLEAFRQLADILNALDDQQQRAAVAAVALGRGWQQAAPLLAMGGQKIGEMVDAGTKASEITTEMAVKAKELNDKWILLVGAGGLLNSIVGEMLGPLLALTNQIIAAKEASSGFAESFARLLVDTVGGFQDENPAAEIARIDVALIALHKTSNEFDKMGPLQKWFSDDDIALANAQIASMEFQRKTLSAIVALPKPAAFSGMAGSDKGGAGVKAAGAAADFLGTDSGKAIKDWATKLSDELSNAYAKADIKQKEAAQTMLADYLELSKKEIHEFDAIADHLAKTYGEAGIKQKEAAEAIMESAAAQGLGIADSLRSATDLEKNSYDERLNNLQLYLATAGMKVKDADALIRAIQVEHEAKLGNIFAIGAKARLDFEKMTSLEQTNFALDQMVQMTAGAAQHNRAMFEINKVAAIANSIVKGTQAVVNSFEWGSSWGGPYGGAAMAAIAAAAVAIQIQTIESATYGGGGVSPSVTGSAGGATPVFQTNAAAAPAASTQTTIVQFQGSQSEEKMIKRFVEMLNQNQRDGGRIVIA